MIAYLAAVKYERLEIENSSKFINQFFYENNFDFVCEVKKVFEDDNENPELIFSQYFHHFYLLKGKVRESY